MKVEKFIVIIFMSLNNGNELENDSKNELTLLSDWRMRCQQKQVAIAVNGEEPKQIFR